MDFEFDPKKSALNLIKHGIDFKKIQEMWDGKVVGAPSLNIGESRYLAVGKLEEKFWTVIITWRGDKIRIISARRSRKNEIQNYKKTYDFHKFGREV